MGEIFTPMAASELYRPGYAAYLFDWDGTLADSHQANYRAMRDALAEHDVPISWEWFNARTGVSSEEMIKMLSSEIDAGAVVAARDDKYLTLLSIVGRIEPVVSVLDQLRAEGRPVALATGGGVATVLPTVDALQLRDHFDTIVSREDAKRGKPEPDIFLVAAERLGAPAHQCLVYEDSDQGVAAAINAGMDVVDVRAIQGRA